MSLSGQLIPKRGGSLNGTYSSEGKVTAFEIRDGKIISAKSLPIVVTPRDISFSVTSPIAAVISNGTTAPIVGWGTERYNTGAFSSSTGIFVAPETGKYTFSGSVGISTSITLFSTNSLYFKLQRIPVGGGLVTEALKRLPRTADIGNGTEYQTTDVTLTINVDLPLDAGDSVYLAVTNDTGISYNIIVGAETFFCGRIIY